MSGLRHGTIEVVSSSLLTPTLHVLLFRVHACSDFIRFYACVLQLDVLINYSLITLHLLTYLLTYLLTF